MLDKLTQSVLDKINTDSDGSYKVMDSSDFLSALPSGMTADENGVSNAIKYLSDRGYVDLKYSDNGTYCVCSMPKGRQYSENAPIALSENPKRGRTYFAIAFAGGFLGALAGGAVIALIITLFL